MKISLKIHLGYRKKIKETLITGKMILKIIKSLQHLVQDVTGEQKNFMLHNSQNNIQELLLEPLLDL
jgi:hypothetical protein